MLIVGLTGGIGSGKTTVSNMFAKLGVPIIDTDEIAHDLVTTDSPVLADIARVFGDTVLYDDGSLDRKKLGRTVFGHNSLKQQLENILHPRIRMEVNRQIKSLSEDISGYNYIIVVIPLLLETGFRDIIDRILVVIADENTRIRRIRHRDGRELDEIRSIMNSQVSDEIRMREADDIIMNNSDTRNLESRILQLHQEYSHSDSIR